MSTLPVKQSRLTVLKDTVAKGLTNSEFAMFMEFCKATKLNPFKREIWAIKPRPYRAKDGNQVQPPMQLMTGFNGFLAIANAHPMFDGMTSEIVKNDDGTIDYATATVYRKDRKIPITSKVFFKEFYKPGFSGKESTWDKQPSVMILKVAKSHALRESFTQELGGLYSQEEMGAESPSVIFEQVNQLNAVKEQEIVEADVEEASEEAVKAVSYEESNQKAEMIANAKENV